MKSFDEFAFVLFVISFAMFFAVQIGRAIAHFNRWEWMIR